jgi:adenine-specific DNA-methyltransferase
MPIKAGLLSLKPDTLNIPMAKASRKPKSTKQKPIEQYEHKDKERLNNPPVGLVDAHTDNGGYKKKTYQYDPHLDPQLQWAGKAEHTSFEVPTVSLHVHERIDPRRIIDTVKKADTNPQMSLFEEQKKPLREAIEFYKHKENWSNRLVAGDSLLVMNSLLVKEKMGDNVQMIFFDPPYGIEYKSNFQPFTNKRDVKEKDEDLTAEPEMLKAFRDTWELGLHSYLTYIRDRLLLARNLLHSSGSIFVQIGDENVHHVREVLDEVFGSENFCSLITFQKSGKSQRNNLSKVTDYLVWYAKDKKNKKFRTLYRDKKEFSKLMEQYDLDDGDGRKYRLSPINSQDYSDTRTVEIEYKGKKYHPGKNRHWSLDPEKIPLLLDLGILTIGGSSIYQKLYLEDQPGIIISNMWDDTSQGALAIDKIYVVQTSEKVVERCMMLTTDPGDLVLDITCGSGTTAFVAENYGRRWITCDTSRVSIALAKQRLMSATFSYYQLAYPAEGIGSGFTYNKVPHIKLSDIANNPKIKEGITRKKADDIIRQNAPMENLHDKPIIDSVKCRVSGPFTVEAVPAPIAKSFDDVQNEYALDADNSIVRSGETLRQDEWRQELLRAGVRAKGGKLIEFTRVEPLSGTRFLQAEAETKEDNPKRVVVCFGPEHAPLEQRWVELALDEARTLRPKPEIVLFCAFHFDPEARKDIEETNWPGITLLEAQMNADLLTDDLKKKRSSNESFWLIGQPDVQIKEIKTGDDIGKYTVEVHGFDYYNPKTGTVDSGGKGDIAMWMLDHDYDGRSLFPSQVFFPMAGAKEGWATLAKNLKAEIDEDKIEAYSGTVSLPFTPGKNVAVKIIDARGIESLKIIRL